MANPLVDIILWKKLGKLLKGREEIYFLYRQDLITRLFYNYLYMGRFPQSLRILANDVGYCYINNHLDIEYLERYSC